MTFSGILKDNDSSMKNRKTKRYSVGIIISFYVLPTVLAIIFMNYDIEKASANLITIVSIFAGLMFNLMVLLFSLAEKTSRAEKPLKYIYLKEVISNVGYTILVSIFLVFIFFLISLGIDFRLNFWIFSTNLEFHFMFYLYFLSVFLFCHFSTCLMMIVSKFYDLVQSELKN